MCRFCEDGLCAQCLDGTVNEERMVAVECECATLGHGDGHCDCCGHSMKICWCEARGCNP